MARFLEFDSTDQLFTANLVKLIETEQGVWLPRMRFKRKPFRFCPFLINEETRGICRLHPDHKPLICAMAPIARVIDFEHDRETWHLAPPVDDCPGMQSKESNKLSDFQREYEQELHRQKRFFALLNRAQFLAWDKESYQKKFYQLDTNRPFEEQFAVMEQAVG